MQHLRECMGAFSGLKPPHELADILTPPARILTRRFGPRSLRAVFPARQWLTLITTLCAADSSASCAIYFCYLRPSPPLQVGSRRQPSSTPSDVYSHPILFAKLTLPSPRLAATAKISPFTPLTASRSAAGR